MTGTFKSKKDIEMPSKVMPPSKIADLDIKSASNLIALMNHMLTYPTVIFLGAGVSASTGLPQWKCLLEEMCSSFFYHWEFNIKNQKQSNSRTPRDLSISFTDSVLYSLEAIDYAKKMSEKDLLLAAQQIKNCIREQDWFYLLRKLLYKNFSSEVTTTKKSKLIKSLISYCSEVPNLEAIINYNYDDVFDQSLRYEIPTSQSVWQNSKKSNGKILPIFHPHGYIPFNGNRSKNIILTESDYQQETEEPYSWANLIQTQYLCNRVCIFFGCSMVDPNLRRLLKIANVINLRPCYTFLPTYPNDKDYDIKSQALFDYDLERLSMKVIRFQINETDNPYSRLPELIELLRMHIKDQEQIWQ